MFPDSLFVFLFLLLLLILLLEPVESLADHVARRTFRQASRPAVQQPSSTTSSRISNNKKNKRKHLYIPTRKLMPPFPDGPCGGEMVTLDPSLTFDIDVRLSGNTLLLPPRPIHVWLPPGYDPNKQPSGYPTLYCHDGQNAVADADSWTGRSWRLTGALTRLHNHGLIDTQPIVVLLPSVNGDLIPGIRRRHLEYGDVTIPFAVAHCDFVALTVKPLVDAKFATDPTACYSIGSSLGGQAGT